LGEDVSDHAGMAKFLEFLEYLPLAISQAGLYMAENSTSISKHLQMYNESVAAVASRIDFVSEDFGDLARDSEAKNAVAAI
jgi:hypothetical protein